MQAEVARAAGRTQLADSLERAAELDARARRRSPRDLHGAAARPRDRGRARGVGVPARGATERRATRRSCARRRTPTATRGLARRWVTAAERRFASREQRSSTASSSSRPGPSSGSSRPNGPTDPEPELVVEDGVVTRLDGRERRRARRDRPLRRRPRHRSRRRRRRRWRSPDERLARMLVDVDVPRDELVRLSRGPDAGQARARHRAARPGRADAGAEEAPRPPRSRATRRT